MDPIVVLADPQAVREINSSAVLATLRATSPLSLAKISAAVGLSRQAVTRSVAALEEAGWVEYLPPSPTAPRAGRPAQLIRFKAEAGYVMGICVSPQQVSVGLADLAGTLLATSRLPVDEAPLGDLLAEQIQSVLASASVDRSAVWFVSAGAPGIVDREAGTISFVPSMPTIAGDYLHRVLRQHLNCPIYIDNDIKLATWGEQWGVDDDNAASLVFVHWGSRVGAGIVIRGELYRGASNDAGDLGFLDLVAEPDAPSAPPPTQPGLGRFERWVGADEVVRMTIVEAELAGDSALLAALNDATSDPLSVVANAAAAGSGPARRAVAESARRFSVGLVAIRALLDPHLVVVGGTMARFGDLLLDAVRAEFNKQPLHAPQLLISTLGDDAIVLGAVRHSLDRIDSEVAPRRHGNKTG